MRTDETTLERILKVLTGKGNEEIRQALLDPESEASKLLEGFQDLLQGTIDVDPKLLREGGDEFHRLEEATRQWRLHYGSAADRVRMSRERQGLSPDDVVEKIRRLQPGSRLTVPLLEMIEEDRKEIDGIEATFLADALQLPLGTLLGSTSPVGEVAFLRETNSSTPVSSEQRVPDERVVRDVERELGDFLPAPLAREMVDAWKRENNLDRWIEPFAEKVTDDLYLRTIIKVLALVSLKKSHSDATVLVDELITLAGIDDHRRCCAYYLRGRQRWYIKEIKPAIESLQQALTIARDKSLFTLDALCCIYLARLSIDYPDQLAEPAESFISEALHIANDVLKGRRRDMELLAKRADYLRLQRAKNHPAVIAIARELLSQAEELTSLGVEAEHILDSVRVDLGVSLRRMHTEEARQEAENYYNHGIQRQRHDSHAGMCLYLEADLYIDRMLEALRKSSERHADSTAAAKYLEEAKRHHATALDLCERSHAILSTVHDLAALQKANLRLMFLHQGTMAVPDDSQAAVNEFATRERHVSHLFLGSPLASQPGPYSPAAPKLNRDQLSVVLNEYFSGLYLSPLPRKAPGVEGDRFLHAGSFLCFPWSIGDTLVVRVFAAKGSVEIENRGWFTVDRYASEIEPWLERILAMDNEEFEAIRGAIFPLLQEKVQTIYPIGKGDQKTTLPVEDAVILAPASNTGWLFPLEWLQTMDPDSKTLAPSLLEQVSRSVVYATSRAPEVASFEVSIDPQKWGIFASTQSFGAKSIAEFAKEFLGERVKTFDVNADQGMKVDQHAAMILAHSDPDGQLVDCLNKWSFLNAKVVVLLFCSSGQYRLVRGPFIDGVAVRIRERLGLAGVVVGSRVPVGGAEAIRFAQELLSEKNRDRPVVAVVSRYLKESATDPFDSPWITLI